MNAELTLRSFAKLNLFLEILGRRTDGFHELETVMVKTQFCDVLYFREAPGEIQLRLSSNSQPLLRNTFPLDKSNLILKAADALQRHVGKPLGAEITIHKRIPSEAGLAGGSSNAASTLLGLNELFGLRLDRTELHAIASTLGSDINFFVEDCAAAVCRGRGELVEPISINGVFYFVAVRPEVGNSTPAVFSRLSMPPTTLSSDAVVDALRRGDATRLGKAIFNRLTEPAQLVNPGMKQLITDVSILAGRPVFMSGSGSTCFLIARSLPEAIRLSVKIRSCGYEVFGPLQTFG